MKLAILKQNGGDAFRQDIADCHKNWNEIL